MAKTILLSLLRLLWIVARAVGSMFLAVHAVVGIIGGWKPFWEQAGDWGVLSLASALSTFVTVTLTRYGVETFLFLVILVLLTYILIDRPRRRSQEEFEERRKKPVKKTMTKPKRVKKK